MAVGLIPLFLKNSFTILLALSLLPSEGEFSVYAQLYILDSDAALQHCLQNTHNQALDRMVLSDLHTACKAEFSRWENSWENFKSSLTVS